MRIARMHALSDREVQSKVSERNGAQISTTARPFGRAPFGTPFLAAPQTRLTNCMPGRKFESFSIGAGWCQALSDCSVAPGFDVARKVLASLRDRHFGPPMMGSGGMRRTNLSRRPCRKTYGRYQDSKRTRLIHRPCGDIAPPIGGIQVFSPCSR